MFGKSIVHTARRKTKQFFRLGLLIGASSAVLCAQAGPAPSEGADIQQQLPAGSNQKSMPESHDSMPGMNHDSGVPQRQSTMGHEDGAMPRMNMVDMNSASMFLMGLSSGTALNPTAWPMPMIMKPVSSWNTMFMAQGFLNYTQQSGPRGGDKLYSTNWFMVNTEHRAGDEAAFQVQLMLSLEPATITDRRYPLLSRPAKRPSKTNRRRAAPA